LKAKIREGKLAMFSSVIGKKKTSGETLKGRLGKAEMEKGF